MVLVDCAAMRRGLLFEIDSSFMETEVFPKVEGLGILPFHP